jgi:hypothetical protein
MDLMGPTRTSSLGGKRYILVIVDDFSRYTWAIPIWEKSDAFDTAQQLFKKIQVELNCQIVRIRSDHGREFENPSSKNSATHKESSKSFPLLSLLSIMELLKGRTG